MRQNQFRVSLSVDGKDYGVWDEKEGGRSEAGGGTYFPGGMAEQIALGGRPERGNLTLRRLFRKDGVATFVELDGKTGAGECVVTVQPLDKNGAAFGQPITWRGVLDACEGPPHDSNSQDAAQIEVEITPHGGPTSTAAAA